MEHWPPSNRKDNRQQIVSNFNYGYDDEWNQQVNLSFGRQQTQQPKVAVPLTSMSTNKDTAIQIQQATTNYSKSKASYQARALFFKTLSYQKRQKCVNFCCVLICPLLFISILGILDILIKMPTAYISTIGPVRYCSNVSNMEPDYGSIPNIVYFNRTLGSQIIDVNFYETSGNDREKHPCVQVLQNNYRYSFPYQQDPGTPAHDSTFLPAPLDGWWKRVYTNRLQTHQMFPWNYIYVPSGVDVGVKMWNESQLLADSTKIPIPEQTTIADKSGFLGRTPTRYYGNLGVGNQNDEIAWFSPTDFYVPVDAKASSDLDLFIAQKLINMSVTYETLFRTKNSSTYSWLPKWLTAANITNRFPFFGLISINSYDPNTNKLNVTLQTGSCERLRIALAFAYYLGNGIIRNPNVAQINMPSKGFRWMQQISQFSNALLRSASSTSSIRNSQISQSIRAFAQEKVWYTGESVVFENMIGKMVYPLGLSFLLPMFVLTLVREKEDKILIMMKMHGLSTVKYYLAHYLHFMILQIACSIVFIVTAVGFQLKFFVETSPAVYLPAFLGWANAMVALSFLLSVFFNRVRLAMVLTFLLVIISFIVSSVVVAANIFGDSGPPLAWFIWPPFAFYHILNAISNAAFSNVRGPYQAKDLVPGDPVDTALKFLFAEGLIMFLMMFYLKSVLPSEYGLSKPWYFIFTDPIKGLIKLFGKGSNPYKRKYRVDGIMDYEPLKEDSDVQEERNCVSQMKLDAEMFRQYPLIVSNVRKVFSNGKVANKAMCLRVERNIIFGLLGPNGAGKSTLIQMLTGIYPASSGTAYVSGYDINTEMDMVHLNIGVCPQHDILWGDLTCEEHLLFYGRLRGISSEQEQAAVLQSLCSVDLQSHRNRLAKNLSGGEKRRLSIAVALIGDAPLVFMDEPTTGLDPEVRRTIWNIIQTARKDKTIILTTHSMEEADFLSSKIGIMSKGVLRCLGTSMHLKQRYGRGFKLTISFYKASDRLAINQARKQQSMFDPLQVSILVESLLPRGKWQKLDQGGVQGTLTYEFEDSIDRLALLMDEIEKYKEEWGIEDWGISQTSLEEVFLNIVKEEDVQATI